MLKLETPTPAPRDERKPVILGYGMWNTGTNPQTMLMRYDGMPIVHTEPRVGTVALVNIDDYNAQAQRAALAESELAEVREQNRILRLGVKGDFDLDAWLDWAKEAERLRAELERVKATQPSQWSDGLILDFLGIALRNVDLQGEVRLSEIRQAFEHITRLAAIDASRDGEGG